MRWQVVRSADGLNPDARLGLWGWEVVQSMFAEIVPQICVDGIPVLRRVSVRRRPEEPKELRRPSRSFGAMMLRRNKARLSKTV